MAQSHDYCDLTDQLIDRVEDSIDRTQLTLLGLTGLLQLVLVIVQSLVRHHADPVHSDLQLLRDWLLTAHTNTDFTI